MATQRIQVGSVVQIVGDHPLSGKYGIAQYEDSSDTEKKWYVKMGCCSKLVKEKYLSISQGAGIQK